MFQFLAQRSFFSWLYYVSSCHNLSGEASKPWIYLDGMFKWRLWQEHFINHISLDDFRVQICDGLCVRMINERQCGVMIPDPHRFSLSEKTVIIIMALLLSFCKVFIPQSTNLKFIKFLLHSIFDFIHVIKCLKSITI